MTGLEALDGISVVVGLLLGAAVVLVWWAATSSWDRQPAPQQSRPVHSGRKSGRTR